MVLAGVCATVVEVTVGWAWCVSPPLARSLSVLSAVVNEGLLLLCSAADRTNLSFTLTRRERFETYLTEKSKKNRQRVYGLRHSRRGRREKTDDV
ncbi:hypothetical protein ACFX15_003911 [Malus domestica]